MRDHCDCFGSGVVICIVVFIAVEGSLLLFRGVKREELSARPSELSVSECVSKSE